MLKKLNVTVPNLEREVRHARDEHRIAHELALVYKERAEKLRLQYEELAAQLQKARLAADSQKSLQGCARRSASSKKSSKNSRAARASSNLPSGEAELQLQQTKVS